MSLLLPAPGQNPYAGPDVPEGQVNLDDVLRTLDRRTDRTFSPWEFDAVGGGEADDTDAINAAGIAARAANGELLINGRFGFAGEVLFPGGVPVRATGTARLPTTGDLVGVEPGLVALSLEAQVLWGRFGDGPVEFGGTGEEADGSLNDNPGPIYNLVIDGAGLGGSAAARGAGLLRIEAVQTSAYDVQVMNSGGDGIVFASAQNVNLWNAQSHGHQNGAAVRWTSRIAGAQPAGHCWLFGGHQGDSYLTYRTDSPDDSFFVGPHDNGANAPIIETGRTPGLAIGAIGVFEDGNFTLVHPTATIGANVAAIDEDASFVVRNETRPAASTILTIVEPNAIGGGAGAVKASDLIRIEQPHDPGTGAPLSAFNEVNIVGTPSFANATQAGVNMSGGPALYTCTNRPRFVTAIPTHVRVTDIYAGVNGLSGFVSRTNTPRRWEVPVGGPSAIGVREDGKAANAWQVSGPGEQRGLDPDTGATRWKVSPVAGGGATLDGASGGPGVLVHLWHVPTASRPLASLVPYRVIWNETTGGLEVSDGVNWLPVGAPDGDGWTYQRLAADWNDNGAGTLSDVFAGFAPAAATSYDVEVFAIIDTPATTTKFSPAIASPAAPDRFSFKSSIFTTANAVASLLLTAPGGVHVPASQVVGQSVYELKGRVRWNGAPGAGNVRLQARSSVAGSLVTVYARSWMRWRVAT